MKKGRELFKIMILEDSNFYNNLLTRQLEKYTDAISMDKRCDFEVRSFTSPPDFIRNLESDIDIAFVDYYLGNGITGSEIIKKIKLHCKDCKIIIISQSQSVKASILTLKEGAKDYVFKDNFALSNSCFIVEDIVNQKLKSNDSQWMQG